MSESAVEGHYDDAYFAWQNAGGDWRGEANAFKFRPHLHPSDQILDFGCGSGALLRALGGRCGVEINPAAIRVAQRKGLDVRTSLTDFPDGSFDVVVSNHALEHVFDPLRQVSEMHRVLRPGGRAVLVVPSERARRPFREDDVNQHLYTWSAGNLGNLVKVAGFKVQVATEIVHAWPPQAQRIQRLGGWPGFHLACRIWGWLFRDISQVLVVATK